MNYLAFLKILQTFGYKVIILPQCLSCQAVIFKFLFFVFYSFSLAASAPTPRMCHNLVPPFSYLVKISSSCIIALKNIEYFRYFFYHINKSKPFSRQNILVHNHSFFLIIIPEKRIFKTRPFYILPAARCCKTMIFQNSRPA